MPQSVRAATTEYRRLGRGLRPGGWRARVRALFQAFCLFHMAEGAKEPHGIPFIRSLITYTRWGLQPPDLCTSKRTPTSKTSDVRIPTYTLGKDTIQSTTQRSEEASLQRPASVTRATGRVSWDSPEARRRAALPSLGGVGSFPTGSDFWEPTRVNQRKGQGRREESTRATGEKITWCRWENRLEA